ncbi:hypothetical protein HYALB_00001566 [Hymenoscyphus albidus]|uniref:Uncharacterized protein n=1 Tax=Hymenoscyphus albidus TaxID=595503 RepID=A0A9N9LEB5_9HELO|nr:hypothetical protein HYALB_00001566 [Hymenoscyphus albidus]
MASFKVSGKEIVDIKLFEAFPDHQDLQRLFFERKKRAWSQCSEIIISRRNRQSLIRPIVSVSSQPSSDSIASTYNILKPTSARFDRDTHTSTNGFGISTGTMQLSRTRQSLLILSVTTRKATHSITPVGPEPPILREDEEVPAVKYALAMAAKK